MSRKKLTNIDLTTGEIQEEIDARADHRADILIDQFTSNPTFFRSQLSRVRTPSPSGGESLTHQSHAESCDINNIIRQYDRTGALPARSHTPQYADVSNLNRPLIELTLEAQEASSALRNHLQAQQSAKAKEESSPPTPAPSPEPSDPSATPPPPKTKE